ncbi:hypothetical protein OAT07_04565 [Candidatus Pelagibacter sp.]|nr:hypothetical protein [Candidatus Pelagibacter sp.]
MRNTLLTLIFTLALFTNANSETYSYGSLGYAKHIAEDPHDENGSTYLSDPEDNGMLVSYGFGDRTGNFAMETEFSYFTEVTQNLTSGVNVDVSTLSLMENFMYAPDLGSNGYLLAGIGLGFGRTNVDTSYSASGDTFSGDKTQTNFAHQLILGFGVEMYEIVFKRSDFGEVEGGKGTSSSGGAYSADEFDSIYNSISLRYKF